MQGVHAAATELSATMLLQHERHAGHGDAIRNAYLRILHHVTHAERRDVTPRDHVLLLSLFDPLRGMQLCGHHLHKQILADGYYYHHAATQQGHGGAPALDEFDVKEHAVVATQPGLLMHLRATDLGPRARLHQLHFKCAVLWWEA